MKDLEGRHVAVTGGTGGLGGAVVDALLAAGAHCHLTCLTDDERDACRHAGHERVTLAAPVDVAHESMVAPFYEGIPSLWGSIHLAGGFAWGPVESVSEAELRAQMDMNAVSCFLCCREAVKAMRRTGAGGRIVNVAARPGVMPELGASMVAYTASKAAVVAMTAALGAEVASEGIWVNAVVPSIIDTPANRQAMADADHDAWAAPEDIANTIVFLASPGNHATRSGLVPVYARS